MHASDLLKCISDPQRLRILNLLHSGPLCVCHLQEILDAPQVKMSKQLAQMKQLGLIDSKREGTWMIYRLNEPADGLLLANLKYLRESEAGESRRLQADLKTRAELVEKLTRKPVDCPAPVFEKVCC